MALEKKALLEICNDDRISNLQDDILTHILSFLPTKYSVRTRVLSKRWKQLFTLVPVLNFFCPSACDYDCDCDCECDGDTARSFVDFVSWVFNSYRVDKMDRFRYSACVALSESSIMHSWISESLRRGVRELDVSVTSQHRQTLPRGVFTCKTLTALKIIGCFDVEFPTDICLPHVKTIHLSNVNFVDGCSASRLFRSCPVLEDLLICLDPKDNQVFNIAVPTLKSLKILISGNFELVLDVPNVEYVAFDGDLANKFSAVQGFKLLNKASILVCNFSDDKYEVIEKLVNMICHVRQLCCSANVLKAFQTRGRSLPTFRNLAHLEMSSCLSSFVPDSLIRFLDRTPHLEVLVVSNDWFEDDELLPENVPACVSLHLKQVEYIVVLDNPCKLMEYLLKNGKVLEMVKIRSANKSLKRFESSKKLQTFPRYSKACRIEYISYEGELS